MKSRLLRFVFGVLAMASMRAGATLVTVTVTGTGGLDPLAITSAPAADELGYTYSFPVGEQIAFSSVNTTYSANVATDNQSLDNKLVSITNLTSFSFPEVFFVASGGGSPGTFTNFDGYVNGSMAMKIDKLGINQSLYSETGGTVDGIFQPGETWQFIVQDYVALTPVDSFYSPYLVGGTDTLPSIIVPEPTGIVLVLLGGLVLLRRRR
ncbi:MAG: PEP-CTERM sorting domain-containing protein [Verrucomicrobiota bacterium]